MKKLTSIFAAILFIAALETAIFLIPDASSSTTIAPKQTLASLGAAASGANADITSTAALNTITAASSTNLVASGGSSGASITIGQGAQASITMALTGTGANQSTMNIPLPIKFTANDGSYYGTGPSMYSYGGTVTLLSNGAGFGFNSANNGANLAAISESGGLNVGGASDPGSGITKTAKGFQAAGVTYANRPTAVAGDIVYITDGAAGNCGDALCTTWGTTVTGGGGSIKLLVWYNGTNWTIIGK